MAAFKSKIDNPLLFCLILSIIACLLGTSVMLKEGGTLYYSLAAITIIGGAGFPLWIFISTKYIVENKDLKITSGPFSWVIPIQSITSIQESQNALTSPALSFDRLEITYGENKVINISPADKNEFMQTMRRKKFTNTDETTKQQATEENHKRNPKKKSKKQKNHQA